MGNMRRRIFASPAIGDKRFPSVVNAANLQTAGFFAWGGVGFDAPIAADAFFADNQLGCLNGGLGTLSVGEHFPGVAFDPLWAGQLTARRDIASFLWDFRSYGFAPTIVASEPMAGMELWGVVAGNYIDFEIQHSGVFWQLAYSVNGGAWTPVLAPVSLYGDCLSNILKVNLVRLDADNKVMVIWFYDANVPGWFQSAPIVINVAGIGDDIFTGSFAPWYAHLGLASSTNLSWISLKNLICQSADIDHVGYAAANPLPQM